MLSQLAFFNWLHFAFEKVDTKMANLTAGENWFGKMAIPVKGTLPETNVQENLSRVTELKQMEHLTGNSTTMITATNLV